MSTRKTRQQYSDWYKRLSLLLDEIDNHGDIVTLWRKACPHVYAMRMHHDKGVNVMGNELCDRFNYLLCKYWCASVCIL